MFFNGIAIFFYPYAIEGWWLNKIQEGNPILLLGHPRLFGRVIFIIIENLGIFIYCILWCVDTYNG